MMTLVVALAVVAVVIVTAVVRSEMRELAESTS